MLTFTSATKIFAYAPPTDMRKGFRGLSAIVREEFRADPTDGSLFLFVNKRRDRMKAIFWDDDGFVIWYKRLEVGTWQLPGSASTTLELEAHELAMILRGIDLKSARRRARYQQPVAV